jgi:hypothetical protein
MKTITRLFIVALIFEINFGCASKNEKYPLDFGFKVESKTDIINSFDSTYLREYYDGDSIVKIQFSIAELKDIYNSIIKNGLDRYPDNYSPTCVKSMTPNWETKLQFRINGEYKNLESVADCRNRLFRNRKNEKINKSIKRIENTVYSKPEVNRLPNTDIIFF